MRGGLEAYTGSTRNGRNSACGRDWAGRGGRTAGETSYSTSRATAESETCNKEIVDPRINEEPDKECFLQDRDVTLVVVIA